MNADIFITMWLNYSIHHALICYRESTSEILSVRDAIKEMQRTLMGSVAERLVLDVRRSFIMKDSLKEAKKEKFDHRKFVKVSQCYAWLNTFFPCGSYTKL